MTGFYICAKLAFNRLNNFICLNNFIVIDSDTELRSNVITLTLPIPLGSYYYTTELLDLYCDPKTTFALADKRTTKLSDRKSGDHSSEGEVVMKVQSFLLVWRF